MSDGLFEQQRREDDVAHQRQRTQRSNQRLRTKAQGGKVSQRAEEHQTKTNAPHPAFVIILHRQNDTHAASERQRGECAPLCCPCVCCVYLAVGTACCFHDCICGCAAKMVEFLAAQTTAHRESGVG